MSEGRFLFRLKIVISSKKILKTKSLVKESIDIKDDIKVTENEDSIQQELFDADLKTRTRPVTRTLKPDTVI